MPRVAVASTDGLSVNEHFGRSKEFMIYEIQDLGEYKLVEHREIHAQAVPGKQDYITKAQLLADVEAVLISQIGPRAEQELRRHGIIALPVSGAIDKALTAYGKRGKFVRNNEQKKSVPKGE